MNAKELIGPFCIAWLCLLSACHRPATTAVEWTGREGFRDGDLVLRCGHGLESQAVTYQSGSTYSHIGILLYDSLQGELLVLHAVPGEAKRGEPEYLKREPLSEFFAPTRANVGAWMRINCPDSIARKAADYALQKVRDSVVFDNDYLLQDTTQLYCTELVWRAYLRQGIDISDGVRSDAPRTFCREQECIFPSDIIKSKTTLFINPFKSKSL
ncbi:MAG: hypothetical protein IKP93_00895 [Paludibacteraceae bacterium]|nr:hypothetical protein [Paludibacteraceae bacterium]